MTAVVIRGPWPSRKPSAADRARLRRVQLANDNPFARLGAALAGDASPEAYAWLGLLIRRSAKRREQRASFADQMNEIRRQRRVTRPPPDPDQPPGWKPPAA